MDRFSVFSDEKLREKYYYLKHKSGLDIYVFPKKMTLKTALLGVKFGSVYELGASVDGEVKGFSSGIAHFLEHKLFSSEDGVDAIETLASLGADANAYTSNNKTVYMFSCTENFKEALAELIKFVYRPYFTDENVESEKGIIGQEIKMCLDSPYDAVSQQLLFGLYGNSKLSVDVLGTQESISKITAKELYDCYNSFYRPSNMMLVVAGDIDEGEVISTVDACIDKYNEAQAPSLPELVFDEAVHLSCIEKQMPVSMPIFEIGIKDKMPSKDVNERLSRDVAMTILDEMLFSRAGVLYNELFESGRINESYSYGYSITRDAAFHSIYAEGSDPMGVFEEVKKYIKHSKEKGLDRNDFVRCKRVMMAEFIRDFDSVDDVANSVLNFACEGSDVFEYRKIIDSVSFDDVCKCLEDGFDEARFTISIIKNDTN